MALEKKRENGRWLFRVVGQEAWVERQDLPPGTYEADRRETIRNAVRANRRRRRHREQRTTKDDCEICLSEPRDAVLTPCFHRIGRRCAAQVNECPLCRQVILSVVVLTN